MKRLLPLTIIAIIILLLGIAFSLSQIQPRKNLSDLTDSDSIQLNVNNSAVDLEVAKSDAKQEAGLMNRTSLDENHGMIFIFDSEAQREFWMKNTLISLDIIYLNKDLKVVNLYKSTQSNQTDIIYPSNLPSQYAIELASGWSESHNLKIGDKFNL